MNATQISNDLNDLNICARACGDRVAIWDASERGWFAVDVADAEELLERLQSPSADSDTYSLWCSDCGGDRVTEAQMIAERFGSDGQRFEDAKGENIVDVCESGCSKCSFTGTDTEKFVFEDGSSIVIAGEGWDLGCNDDLDCVCWESMGCRCAD